MSSEFERYAKSRMERFEAARRERARFWTEKRLDILVTGAVLLALVLAWRLV